MGRIPFHLFHLCQTSQAKFQASTTCLPSFIWTVFTRPVCPRKVLMEASHCRPTSPRAWRCGCQAARLLRPGFHNGFGGKKNAAVNPNVTISIISQPKRMIHRYSEYILPISIIIPGSVLKLMIDHQGLLFTRPWTHRPWPHWSSPGLPQTTPGKNGAIRGKIKVWTRKCSETSEWQEQWVDGMYFRSFKRHLDSITSKSWWKIVSFSRWVKPSKDIPLENGWMELPWNPEKQSLIQWWGLWMIIGSGNTRVDRWVSIHPKMICQFRSSLLLAWKNKISSTRNLLRLSAFQSNRGFLKWRVLPNHPFYFRIFQYLNQPFWGSPIYYGNPHLWRYKTNSKGQLSPQRLFLFLGVLLLLERI